MKLGFKWPSSMELRKMFQVDPLRQLQERKLVATEDNVVFTLSLARRIDCSRLDPRLLESSIERLVLFPEKVVLDTLVECLKVSPWPRVFNVVFNFGVLASNNMRLKEIKTLSANFIRQLSPSMDFQAYYIHLYRPASRMQERAMEENLKVFEHDAFFAGTVPYSKELLQYLRDKKLLSVQSNRAYALATRSLNAHIRRLLQESSHTALKISDLFSALHGSLSTRQIQRILGDMPDVKKSGTLKGTRYLLRL